MQMEGSSKSCVLTVDCPSKAHLLKRLGRVAMICDWMKHMFFVKTILYNSGNKLHQIDISKKWVNLKLLRKLNIHAGNTEIKVRYLAIMLNSAELAKFSGVFICMTKGKLGLVAAQCGLSQSLCHL